MVHGTRPYLSTYLSHVVAFDYLSAHLLHVVAFEKDNLSMFELFYLIFLVVCQNSVIFMLIYCVTSATNVSQKLAK